MSLLSISRVPLRHRSYRAAHSSFQRAIALFVSILTACNSSGLFACMMDPVTTTCTTYHDQPSMGCTTISCDDGSPDDIQCPEEPPDDPPDDGGGDDGGGGEGDSCSMEGSNPLTVHDGSVHRRVDDLAAVAPHDLVWQRFHTSLIRRGAAHDALGTAGAWRHTWQFDLFSEQDGVNGGLVYQLIYPSGQRSILRPEANGGLRAPAGVPELGRILSDGIEITAANDATLFFAARPGAGSATRYDCTRVTMAEGRVYDLGYDGQGRLIEVRNPDGKWLRFTYRDFAVRANAMRTIAHSSVVPTRGQWMEVAIPPSARVAAKTVLARVHEGGSVAEVQFFAEGSSQPLTGESFSPATAGAVDGNTATVFATPTKARAMGIRLAAGNTVRLERVRVLAAPGAEASLVDTQVLVQIAEPPMTTASAIARVEASNGRAVSYVYELKHEAGGDYVALTEAHYGDGTKARYRYSDAPIPGNQPLLLEADDPRYAGVAKRIAYDYYDAELDGRGHGTIKAEKNPITGAVWAALEFDPNDPGKRLVHYSDLRTIVYRILTDGTGRIAERTDSLGRKQRFEYAPGTFGRHSAAVDYAGRRTEVVRNNRGQAERVTKYDGKFSAAVRDGRGRQIEARDVNGRTTKIERDPTGRVARVQFPDGTAFAFTRDANGRVIRRVGRGGDERYTYDANGHRITTTDAKGYVTRFVRDSRGAVAEVINALGGATRYERNERGLVTKILRPDGTVQAFVYDEYGRKTAETDIQGRTTRSAYDELSRVVQTIDATGGITTFEYAELPLSCGTCSLSGRPTRIISPDGTIASMLYDTEGRLLARTVATGTPAEATTTYSYDNDGNVVATVDSLGRITRQTYDEDRHL
jgi:YD repeat-containing protein